MFGGCSLRAGQLELARLTSGCKVVSQLVYEVTFLQGRPMPSAHRVDVIFALSSGVACQAWEDS